MNAHQILIEDNERPLMDKLSNSISRSVKRCYEELLRFNSPGVLAPAGINSSAPFSVQVSPMLQRRQHTGKPVSYINYDINEGQLAVMMLITKECLVEISLFSTGLFHGTSQKELFKGTLAPGERFIRFEEKALAGFGAKLMAIKVEGKVFYMQRL